MDINSDYYLPEVNSHFKVSAGPGAGKTYWLVNHIKNILHNSDLLSVNRKVACITYTNTAVETILKRLGTSSTQVEVSTIHSFLYKHIVKPYLPFIAEQYNVNFAKVNGHDDIKTSFRNIINWLENHPNKNKLKHPFTYNQLIKLPQNKSALINWLDSTSYSFNSSTNDTDIIVNNSKAFATVDSKRQYLNKTCLRHLEANLLEYKQEYWKQGKVSHDDLLFFSFHLLKQYPFLSDVLLAKFPYLVIDEFQDSNPIQVEIFRTLASAGIHTGVIGDPCQSIYEFQGASYTQFESFTLPNIKEYTLTQNRRSSNEIIELLNSIRTDITQTPHRNDSIEKPKILIGDMSVALRKCKTHFPDEVIHSLSRNNITSNAMKAEISNSGLDSKLLDKLSLKDSGDRGKLISSCIKAIAFAQENKFKDAIKVFEEQLNYKNDKLEGKKKALKYISILLEKFNEYKDSSLLEFAEFIRNNINSDLKNFRPGKIKTFYADNSFQSLLLCVSIPDDLSLHKTIHKSKGDEFDNVLLVLTKEEDIEFLYNPDLSNEEHRINYVGVSRARNRLFISVPTLSQDKVSGLSSLCDIEVVN
ncbi:ATP-dependent helicase [Psychrobacter sp. HD31]|uniref:UvrD-helicase domain-containing protein n=1 Tax=Psychrobacter sp. HD31 TaxID=3112003 RepID=UPI003DA42880